MALVGGLEAAQELHRLGPRRFAGPADGRRRRGGEGRLVQLSQDGQVVIADQAQRAALGDQARALVRLSAVPHHVPEAPELIGAGALDVGEHRLQGRQVGVDVADDRQSHGRSGLS